ncbi:MAG: hypothetical protein RL483_943 [Pseudomonadota bacterium]|jgi:hypothetical protein
MDEDFKAAQQALAVGAYYQAFEIFFMMEQASTDSNFINCCRMAMSNQLCPEHQQQLFERLEHETRMNNGRAAYNYALVLERLGQHNKKVTELLHKAQLLGVPEAESSLNKFIYTGKL